MAPSKKILHDAMQVASIPSINVAVLFLTLLSMLSFQEYLSKQPVNVAVLVVAFLLAIIFISRSYSSISQTKLPTPEESKYFYPFVVANNEEQENGSHLLNVQREKFLVPRKNDVLAMQYAIKNRKSQHIVLTGRSGVGKSTLALTQLKGDYNEKFFMRFTEYDCIFTDVLAGISSRLDDTDVDSNLALSKKISDCIDQYHSYLNSDSKQLEELSKRVDAIFESIEQVRSKDLKFFFLFDQSERLFAGLSKADLGFGTGSSRVIAAAGMLFDKLRFVEFAVAVYVVRSEFVVSALTMFQEFSISSAQIDNFATFNPENRPEAFTDLVSINIVHGINSLENIDAFNSYRAKFLASCRTLDFEKLANTLSLRSKNDANTFYTHLAGYVIEHFVDLDIEIKNFAEGRTDNKELVLEKFFQFLREEYAHLKQDETSKQIIDLTLYTLAVENQRTMLPLTSIELAGLAHHPLSEVADCLEFLESKGIVACRIESSKRFRIVHDLITDHIISSQYISVANAHKDFIAQLSETQSDKKEFIVPEITPNIFDVFSSKNRITIPQVIILASIAFCIVRLFLPNFIFDWMAPINESLNFMLPGVVQTFGHNSWYYFPIIFMQGFWVSYMYYLDRGYFCYVLKSEGWIVRSLSKYSSPAGGIAGCLFAFAPSLMAVPIIVGALGCATVYLVHSYSSNIGGFIRHNNTELSAKIYFMALLMVAWTFVLGRVLVPYGENGVDPTACLIIWLSSIGLFGYWWAMRTRQGSQAGRSSMLTMYERGRKKQ